MLICVFDLVGSESYPIIVRHGKRYVEEILKKNCNCQEVIFPLFG